MHKILFTATYAQPYLSGITDYIQRVTEHLAKQHAVTLLVFQHEQSLALTEKKHGVLVRRVTPDFKLSKGFITWLYPLIAWREVKKADEVFINLPQVESIWVAFAAALQHKKLTVIYHCELVFETGLVNKVIAVIANFLAGIVCYFAQTIIAYTDDYAQNSPILRPYLHKVVAVIPPVELEKADVIFAKILVKKTTEHAPLIGFSGRVSREKGLAFLLGALERLQKKYPKILLLCAGPFGAAVAGEQQYYEELNETIKAKKLPVLFLGRLTKNELAAFYQKISVLVLPSTNRTEAFGLVQAEALLAGTAVVTSDLPGVRAAVKLTDGGKVVPTKNPVAISDALAEILKNPTQFNREKISQKAQRVFSLQKTLAWFLNYTT
jgi:glycosyltransferase involved in cell wall biosynthesis